MWSHKLSSSIYFRVDSLCNSLNNNEIPLLTVTAPDCSSNPIQVNYCNKFDSFSNCMYNHFIFVEKRNNIFDIPCSSWRK